MVALSEASRHVDTPKKRAIPDKMFAEKFEAKSKSYLRRVRKAAMIDIVDAWQNPPRADQGGPPGIGPDITIKAWLRRDD